MISYVLLPTSHPDDGSYTPTCILSSQVTPVECDAEYNPELSCPTLLTNNEQRPAKKTTEELPTYDWYVDQMGEEDTTTSYYAYLQTAKHLSLTALVKYHLGENQFDSARYVLVQDGSKRAKMMLIPLNISRNAITEAQSLLTAFTPVNQEEEDFKDLHQWLVDILGDGRDFDPELISDPEQTELRSIAAGETPYAKSAQAILWKTYGEAMPVSYASYGGGSRRPNPELVSEQSNKLLAFPNPSSEAVFIQYGLDNPLQKGEIIISDLWGRTIWQSTLTQSKGQVEWTRSDVPAGIYLVRLVSSGEVLAKQKVILLN